MTFNLLAPYLMKEILVDIRIDRIASQSIILKNHIINENYFETGSSSVISSEIEHISTLYESRIEIIDSELRIVKDTYIIDEGKISVTPTVLKALEQGSVTYEDSEENYVEYAMCIVNENSSDIMGVLFIVIDLEDVFLEVESMADTLRLSSVIILLVGGTIVGVAIVGAFHPFRIVGSSIQHIAEGNLDDEMPMQKYHETMQIEAPVNRLLERLKHLEESRQEFVSNVSHELKTPIASIKVLADSLMLQEKVPEEIYREFLGDIVTEIDRENQIITDLLTLVKMDKNRSPLNIERVNLNEMCERILKRLRPLAAKRNIELVLESFRPVIAEADEVKLTMAISNLVENAIKYNILDGWVRVSLNADHRFAYIKVADSGIGIPEESVDQVFERFYRVDKDRNRETGGTGLGLAITRNIISMHNGEIKLYSRENEGTTFTVRIPLNYVRQ